MSTPTPEEAFLEYARSTGWDETAVRVVLDTVRKARQAAALEMRALLKELDELRTLAHDLLLDRDAAYGREVGRGEALAVVEKIAGSGLTLGEPVRLELAARAIQALGPVRPLPPPERLAARCRALEDALRAVVSAWDDPGALFFPQETIDAARKLLEEISAEK